VAVVDIQEQPVRVALEALVVAVRVAAMLPVRPGLLIRVVAVAVGTLLGFPVLVVLVS